jgi:hypothetical protein
MRSSITYMEPAAGHMGIFSNAGNKLKALRNKSHYLDGALKSSKRRDAEAFAAACVTSAWQSI